jgi:hypothetical protein
LGFVRCEDAFIHSGLRTDHAAGVGLKRDMDSVWTDLEDSVAHRLLDEMMRGIHRLYAAAARCSRQA